MVLLAGTDKIDETPARPRIRVGASRARPPRTSTARRDAPQADRLHHLDGRELATKKGKQGVAPLVSRIAFCGQLHQSNSMNVFRSCQTAHHALRWDQHFLGKPRD